MRRIPYGLAGTVVTDTNSRDYTNGQADGHRLHRRVTDYTDPHGSGSQIRQDSAVVAWREATRFSLAAHRLLAFGLSGAFVESCSLRLYAPSFAA